MGRHIARIAMPNIRRTCRADVAVVAHITMSNVGDQTMNNGRITEDELIEKQKEAQASRLRLEVAGLLTPKAAISIVANETMSAKAKVLAKEERAKNNEMVKREYQLKRKGK
jgi:hypothetical protein